MDEPPGLGMDRQDTRVEAAVIGTYQRELPSVHFIEDKTYFERRQKMREDHFRFALNFPPEMFAGKSLLDLGGGTGENTIFYSLWGAACTIVDANPKALDRARMIFDTYCPDRKTRFTYASLFDFSAPEQFDIVVSDGVCHHTHDKKGCFSILASCLRPQGYCYFGIGNASGAVQRHLQRLILYRFAKNDDEFVELAERLFPEHLERASRFGQRSKRAIVFDSFINPKHDQTHVAEIVQWFKENGIVFYSSYPKISVPFACDGPDRGTFLDLNGLALSGIMPELFWMTHNLDDAEASREYLDASKKLASGVYRLSESLNNIGPDSAIDAAELSRTCRDLRGQVAGIDLFRGSLAGIEAFLDEFERILAAVNTQKREVVEREIKQATYVFKGPHGLGMSYFVGYKA
jgi:SAM-dependent methyltransferase